MRLAQRSSAASEIRAATSCGVPRGWCQRRLRAQIAANARWSKYMACEDQATVAKSAIFARLERQVGPDGTLPSDERARLVRAAAGELSARLNAAKARKRTRPSG